MGWDTFNRSQKFPIIPIHILMAINMQIICAIRRTIIYDRNSKILSTIPFLTIRYLHSTHNISVDHVINLLSSRSTTAYIIPFSWKLSNTKQLFSLRIYNEIKIQFKIFVWFVLVTGFNFENHYYIHNHDNITQLDCTSLWRFLKYKTAIYKCTMELIFYWTPGYVFILLNLLAIMYIICNLWASMKYWQYFLPNKD